MYRNTTFILSPSTSLRTGLSKDIVSLSKDLTIHLSGDRLYLRNSLKNKNSSAS